LRYNIFNTYSSLFRKSDHKKADIITLYNEIPRTYNIDTSVSIETILLTQKNTRLLDYIKDRFDLILDMELRDMVKCVGCFVKRDKMSIIYSIFMDNSFMNRSVTCEEFLIEENISRYISNKYEEIARYYSIKNNV